MGKFRIVGAAIGSLIGFAIGAGTGLVGGVFTAIFGGIGGIFFFPALLGILGLLAGPDLASIADKFKLRKSK